MAYFAIFRNMLKQGGITLSAEDVLRQMRDLRTALYVTKGSRKIQRQLQDPTETQQEVLRLFGYEVKDGWVLQIKK